MKAQDKQFPPCTVSKFAQLIGIDRHQLQKRVTELDLKPQGTKNGGSLYALKDLIHAHIGGDEKQERIRKLRAESLRLELANSEKQSELVPAYQVGDAIGKVVIALKEKVLASELPKETKHAILQDIKSLRAEDILEQ